MLGMMRKSFTGTSTPNWESYPSSYENPPWSGDQSWVKPVHLAVHLVIRPGARESNINRVGPSSHVIMLVLEIPSNLYLPVIIYTPRANSAGWLILTSKTISADRAQLFQAQDCTNVLNHYVPESNDTMDSQKRTVTIWSTITHIWDTTMSSLMYWTRHCRNPGYPLRTFENREMERRSRYLILNGLK